MTEKTSKLTPDADSLAKSASALNKKGPAPVHLWNPPFCGNLDIRIARDGTWYYLGTPIGLSTSIEKSSWEKPAAAIEIR